MDEKQRSIETMQLAIQSMNKAWDILGTLGLDGLVPGGTQAGCTEYCGSYNGCTGYCKPMGATRLGDEVINPADQGSLIKNTPFS